MTTARERSRAKAAAATSAALPAGRRCAIYTRKSSEEGLEQSFNSLHAQREACEAYIKSQAHEGWRVLTQPYDDGGFSGGSMDRPGLVSLLSDIEQGRIDVVVVYKVDRLTRSLADFARIVDAFDRRQVSFVSVPQAFNTTTSMGRLTLNVVLSFAQFEREVTGERIRDKIAASKKKGMWMGGNLPLGYDRQDNTLVMNPTEAAQVNAIFERYLAVGSVDALRQELAEQGVRSKSRVTRAGKTIGGAVFSRGALYYLLSNLHYRGMIRHKDQQHAGLHPAIVDEALFEAVQRRLAAQRVARDSHGVRAAPARLTGRIVSASGTPFTPSFSYGRGGRLYRYYIAAPPGEAGTAGSISITNTSSAANTTSATPAKRPIRLHRLPAEPLEAFIEETLARLAGRPNGTWPDLDPLLVRIEVREQETQLLLDAEALFGPEHPEFAWHRLREHLAPGEQAVAEPGQPNRLRIRLPVALRFRGGRSWITGTVQSGGVAPCLRPDPHLIAGLRKAHAVLAEQGIDLPNRRFAVTAKAPPQAYQRKLCAIALLAPNLQRAILNGHIPAYVTLQDLLDRNSPPLLWHEQTAWLAGHLG